MKILAISSLLPASDLERKFAMAELLMGIHLALAEFQGWKLDSSRGELLLPGLLLKWW